MEGKLCARKRANSCLCTDSNAHALSHTASKADLRHQALQRCDCRLCPLPRLIQLGRSTLFWLLGPWRGPWLLHSMLQERTTEASARREMTRAKHVSRGWGIGGGDSPQGSVTSPRAWRASLPPGVTSNVNGMQISHGYMNRSTSAGSALLTRSPARPSTSCRRLPCPLTAA